MQHIDDDFDKLKPGTMLDGKYEIVRIIGSGGWGRVYEAIQTDPFSRTVAIKILSTLKATDDSNARLTREALMLSKLNHQSIVSVFGLGFLDEAPYLVMEFVDGHTLQSELESGKPLNIDRVINLMRQLCDALAYIHKEGLVHRDLKPENILITNRDGAVAIKLIDLGLGRLLPESGISLQKLTEAGHVVGTIAYICPEQAYGGEADARSDIYSLGIVMHYCLTGSLPFHEDSDMAMLISHAHKPPPLLESINPAANIEGIQSIIYKAMAKSPDDRYQNADEMRVDLELVAAGRGQSITKAHSLHSKATKEFEPPTRRQSRWLWHHSKSNVAVAVCLAIASLVFLVSSRISQPQTSLSLYNQAIEEWKSSSPARRSQALEHLQLAMERNYNDHLLSADIIPREMNQALFFYWLDKNDGRAKNLLKVWLLDCCREDDATHLSARRIDELKEHIRSADGWAIILEAAMDQLNDHELRVSFTNIIRNLPVKQTDANVVRLLEENKAECVRLKICASDLVAYSFLLARYYKEHGDWTNFKKYTLQSYTTIMQSPENDCEIIGIFCQHMFELKEWAKLLDCAQASCASDLHMAKYAYQIIALDHLGRHQEAMAVFYEWKDLAQSQSAPRSIKLMQTACHEMDLTGHRSDATKIRRILLSLEARYEAQQ